MLLEDKKSHLMHHNNAPPTVKLVSGAQHGGKAQVDVFRQLTQHSEAGHEWEFHQNGVRCRLCFMRIKVGSTHGELSTNASASPGMPDVTLKGLLDEMVSSTQTNAKALGIATSSAIDVG